MKAPNSNIQAPEKLQTSNNGVPFFNTPDRILRLNLAAAKWRGTPWRPNSSAAGVGVSCHNLPRALYIESQFLPESFPKIESLPATATAENQMEAFLDGRPEFEPLQPFNALTLQPGDLLGLFVPIDNVGKRIRNSCVNHLGVVLPEGWFIHTLMKKNTDVDLYSVSPWSQIIKAVWRPVVSAECPTESGPVRLGQTKSNQLTTE
ncbi:MAG TPA: hypothetical protein VKV04_04420 [Verrucomicrobiae bacterium]|nr:hypothetical protein [Verrucomicrobiae bacterium]